MKKLKISALIIALMAMVVAGCSQEEKEAPKVPAVEEIVPGVNDVDTLNQGAEPTEEPEPEVEEEKDPEGMYRSELTNEWIDETLKNQRPIAVMVDNERTALDHFGVNSADIVYEMMNSTENDRISRLMVVMKDWKNVEQLGSIRSTRPTNFMIAAEYNAILIHDGGPFYNDEYYKKSYVNNLSGGFARFINGKNLEFTEYVTAEEYTNTKGKKYDGLNKRIEDAKYSTEYNEFYPGTHFEFAEEENDLSSSTNAKDATYVKMPFYHNSSELKYNKDTNLYEYYEYGKPHIDALTGEVTAFKNAIVYGVSHTKLDANGYLIYNVIGKGDHGYFLTNGKAIPISWIKPEETAITEFYIPETGEKIKLNTGKTYIAIIPDDTWNEVVVSDGSTPSSDANTNTTAANTDTTVTN
ncbi:MAG: DUF3048 domain-containing protein [Lachnospiraceae bacterium]|nr:DUF3048 domain-containing protein [Lachnospiraceae bacterium]